MNCPSCKAEMVDMIMSSFCPNNCDRKPKIKTETDDLYIVFGGANYNPPREWFERRSEWLVMSGVNVTQMYIDKKPMTVFEAIDVTIDEDREDLEPGEYHSKSRLGRRLSAADVHELGVKYLIWGH